MTDIHLLLLAALVTWASLLLAASLRARSWTAEGRRLSLGNREVMPAPTPIAGRADRAAANNVENLVLFVAAFVAARLSGAAPESLLLGAHLFVWARCVFVVVYLAGIPYLRTLVYMVSLAGTFLVASAAF